jgi:hypothetical protein
MYYTYTATDLPAKKHSFVDYVNSLRSHFTIRAEVNRIKDVSVLKMEHLAVRNELEKYLLENVTIDNYHMQKDSGYHGLFYIWFMHKEDALAFMLKFGGKVV